MKSRCKRNGSRKKSESLAKKDTTPTVAPKGDFSDSQQPVLHDSRLQKQITKVSSQKDHAGSTTKESSSTCVIENESSNLLCPGVSTRSSSRPNKRQRCSSPCAAAAGSQDTKAVVNGSNGGGSVMKVERKKKKKEKRQWESWGPEDKDTFFEALHAYGKDFDKVQNFIATRQKRRGEMLSLIKNKDQVRHFYYRTLNKISKYIPPEKLAENDTQKKTLYELLSLICYGELRKKMQGLNEKLGRKLNELINDGATSIRYNQRNIRIKAPTGRALKKLLDNGDSHPPPVPSKLVIEIVPLDNTAWSTVQRLARNPRLRTTVSSKKQLGGLLSYLSNKWPIVSTTENVLDIAFVIPTEFDSSSICDNLDRGRKKSSGNSATFNQCDTSNAKDNNVVEETSISSEKTLTHERNSSHSPDLLDSAEVIDCGKENWPSSLIHSNLDTNFVSSNLRETRGDDKYFQECETEKENASNENMSKNELKYWTLQNCGSITVGDVYCKTGRPSKVKLQYCWKGQNSKINWNQDALQKLIKVAVTEFRELKENRPSESFKSSASKQTVSKISSNNSQTSKKTRIAPKRVERLPFLLPSVVPSSVSVQDSSKPSATPASPSSRPISRARKQQRKSTPVIHQRTLLPRPANSVPTVAASAVPPGAVAVSFIPQPGQAVGTILAAGVSTTSASTVTPQLSASKHLPSNSSGFSTSSQTLTSISSPATHQASSPEPVYSFETKSTSSLPLKTIDLSELPSDNAPSAIQHTQTNAQTVVISSESSLLSGQSNPSTSQDSNVLQSFDLDDFVSTSVRNSTPEGTSTDSIIGLALGSVLNHNNMPAATISEDSASEFLNSFLSTNNKDINSCTDSGDIFITENTGPQDSAVHIEELNSGVSGGTMVSIANGVWNDESIPLINQITSVETFVCTDAKHSMITTAPLMGPSEILCSATNGEKTPDHSLLPTSITSSVSPVVSPMRVSSPGSESQWLHGEASDISMSSFLDKIVTSPEKRTENFGLSLPIDVRDSSQDSLLPHRLMDMDTAFNVMMEENSVDYIKKFQDLTNRMTGPTQSNSPLTSPKTFDPSKDTTSTSSESVVSFSTFFSKQDR